MTGNITGSRCQTTPFNGRRIIIGRNSLDLINGSDTEFSIDLRNFFQAVGDAFQPVTFILQPNQVKDFCFDNIEISDKIRTLWAFATYISTDVEYDECLLWAWSPELNEILSKNAQTTSDAENAYQMVLNQMNTALAALEVDYQFNLEFAQSNLDGLSSLASRNRDIAIAAANEIYQETIYLNPNADPNASSIKNDSIAIAQSTYATLVNQYQTDYTQDVIEINVNYQAQIVSTTAEYTTRALTVKNTILLDLLEEPWKPFHKVLALSGTWNSAIPNVTKYLLDPVTFKNPNTDPVTVKMLVTN